MGVCHLQLITFMSCWSCLGFFSLALDMSFGGQRAILWGICQVANEIGFIEETVK